MLKKKNFFKYNLIFFLFNSLFFLLFPQIDIFFSKLFYHEGFFLDHHINFIKDFRSLLKTLMIIFPILCLIYFVILTVNSKQNILNETKSKVLRKKIILLGFIIGPIIGCGLIANMYFKDTWGRARPINIEEFGGSKIYTPPFFKSNQCERNCSWISGEASAAFSFLVGTVMIRKNGIFLFYNLIFGVFVIFARLSMGGHFLSDNLFAINFMIFLAYLYRFAIIQLYKRKIITTK